MGPNPPKIEMKEGEGGIITRLSDQIEGLVQLVSDQKKVVSAARALAENLRLQIATTINNHAFLTAVEDTEENNE